MKKNYRDLTIAPFSYLTPSLTNISTAFLVLLVPQIVMLIVTKAFSSLILITISILASVLAEFISNKVRRINTLFDLTAIVQGLFIGMFIPQNYPILPVFFIVLLSLLLVKYSNHSLILFDPSKRLNSVWTCKCAKLIYLLLSQYKTIKYK